ncbi:ABC transporter permease [Phosphitispora sp. TUW77]|uniref:ABC transporter permease n=1 Tax=Phosphitispora sp. TUW77 TaxID=3152361 RepID=UPI003AB3272D
MKDYITKGREIALFSVVLVIILWKIISLTIASELLLPAPEKVFLVMVKLVTSVGFACSVGFTVLRGLLGFVISLVMGIITGIMIGLNRTFDVMIKPVLVAIRATPVISIILLALIWLSADLVPVLIGFLVMYPIISTNVAEGIKSVDRELIAMAKAYRVKTSRLIRELYIPAISPFIIGGISNAAGIGWKAVIASEVLSQPGYAIGTRMHTAHSYLIVAELVSWTVIAVILSYIFETLIRFIEKRVVAWRQEIL